MVTSSPLANTGPKAQKRFPLLSSVSQLPFGKHQSELFPKTTAVFSAFNISARPEAVIFHVF